MGARNGQRPQVFHVRQCRRDIDERAGQLIANQVGDHRSRTLESYMRQIQPGLLLEQFAIQMRCAADAVTAIAALRSLGTGQIDELLERLGRRAGWDDEEVVGS